MIFDTHIIVDWSARSRPSPARPTKDSIWWCAAKNGIADSPKYARTRHEAIDRLAAVLAAERDRQPSHPGRIRLSLRLSDRRRPGSDGPGIRSLAMGLAGRSNRGRRGQREQPLRSGGDNQPDLSRRGSLLGSSCKLAASRCADAQIRLYAAGRPSTGTSHRRLSRPRRQDRLAISLRRVRRLAGVVGIAGPEAAGLGTRESRAKP